MTPRILFSDENLTRTDIDLLSLIISLALNKNYCYATNKYLADYINTSKRTITQSISNLKDNNYIIISDDKKGNRKIYLNTEKIPIKTANKVEKNCSNSVAESCYHNINNKYKNDYINKCNYKTRKFKQEGIVPYWLKHPEVCKNEEPTQKEKDYMQSLIDETINMIENM